MALHSDFDDDCPEGIEGESFSPKTKGFTPVELVIGGVFVALFWIVAVHWLVPYLKSAATAALLLASASQ